MVVDPQDKRLRLIDFGSAAAMGLEKRGHSLPLDAESYTLHHFT